MPDNLVTVLEFVVTSPPYRKGERAGFDNPDVVGAYVNAKLAIIVERDVPRVSAEVLVGDTERQVEQLRNGLAVAERNALEMKGHPETAAAGEDALRRIAETRADIDAIAKRLEMGDLPSHGARGRQPRASARAV